MSHSWAKVAGSPLSHFYPHRSGGPNQALYSPGSDRLVLVDPFDPLLALHAAKLLSAKMLLQVFILPRDQGLSLDNENCLNWSLQHKDIRLSDTQTPVLRVLESMSELCEEGALPADSPWFQGDQEFVQFVWRATYALSLTDAQLNLTDHHFYHNLFTNSADNFNLYADETKWPKGFVRNIEQILYLSQSVDEALSRLAQMLPLAKLSGIRKEYAQTFFTLLGWTPTP